MLLKSTVATNYNPHFCFHTHICDVIKGLVHDDSTMHNSFTDMKILYPL